VNLT